MPYALKTGYSKATVKSNIGAMALDGVPRVLAIRRAFDLARASFFKTHPQGALPEWLAWPHGRRMAKHYTPSGAPLRDMAEVNPVRELDITDAERDAIRREVQKAVGGRGRAVSKAARLYSDFTGHTDANVAKVQISDMPKAVLAIGQVDGILYSTIRDGLPEKYIHRFKKASRPQLCASPDGKQLYLLGGAYDFTERGIVDK